MCKEKTLSKIGRVVLKAGPREHTLPSVGVIAKRIETFNLENKMNFLHDDEYLARAGLRQRNVLRDYAIVFFLW